MLYGLKEAPKQWHERFDRIVLSNGSKTYESDMCVYSKFHEIEVWQYIYADDMLICGTILEYAETTKTLSNFNMMIWVLLMLCYI